MGKRRDDDLEGAGVSARDYGMARVVFWSLFIAGAIVGLCALIEACGGP